MGKDTLRDQVGIVHGLAWTAVGGVTLKIEVNVMPGKGAIQVTGSLGNVMKESAQAAISYIRSQSRKYKIKQDFFENMIYIFIFQKEPCQKTDHLLELR